MSTQHTLLKVVNKLGEVKIRIRSKHITYVLFQSSGTDEDSSTLRFHVFTFIIISFQIFIIVFTLYKNLTEKGTFCGKLKIAIAQGKCKKHYHYYYTQTIF